MTKDEAGDREVKITSTNDVLSVARRISTAMESFILFIQKVLGILFPSSDLCNKLNLSTKDLVSKNFGRIDPQICMHGICSGVKLKLALFCAFCFEAKYNSKY